MPHREPAETVVCALGSDAARGLTRAEAQQRLEQYGPNRLKSAPETPWWTRLLEQFQNFLVIILLVAVVISMIEWLLQDPRETDLPYEAIVIMAIVMLNALLGFIQEARAEKSVRALMALAAPEATVVRDGERQRVTTDEIVPGDIVMVEAGDKIPADARLIEVANLQTNEAPLTGESVPVSKKFSLLSGDVGLGDRRNMLFSGTVATYGRGRAVVVATGMETEVGRIAGLLEVAEKQPTPLQQELDRTGKRLSVIMLAICAVVFAAGLFSTTTFTLNVMLGLFLFAVALAVAAIPEALPAIVTVGLSLGVRRMAAAHAIVRKLPAVETLGAATVICSDKTGTLTRNEMTVRAILTAEALVEVGGSGYVPEGEFTVGGAKARRTVRHSRCRRENAPRGGARQRRGAREQRGALEGAGRSDRRRADRRGTQARHGRVRVWRAFPVSRRSPSPPNASATPPSISIAKTSVSCTFSSKVRRKCCSRTATSSVEDGKIVTLDEPRRADDLDAQRRTRRPGAPHARNRHAHRAGRRIWASIRGLPSPATARRRSSCRTASRTTSCCSASSV